MNTKILPNTIKAFAGSWRLYLLYALIASPLLIINQVMATVVSGQPPTDPNVMMAMLSVYCCLIIGLLAFIVFAVAAVPFYTVGFAGALREAFFERPVTIKAMWQAVKMEYLRSLGLFGIYVACVAPAFIIVIAVVFVVLGTGNLSDAEMMSGEYIYTNPIILTTIVLLYLITSVVSIWQLSANGALAAGAGTLGAAAKAPFRFVGKLPEYMISFLLIYMVYVLLNLAANIVLPGLVPYAEWGLLAVNVLISPAIYLLMISFLVAVADGFFAGGEESN